jgi:hypothetical protein
MVEQAQFEERFSNNGIKCLACDSFFEGPEELKYCRAHGNQIYHPECSTKCGEVGCREPLVSLYRKPSKEELTAGIIERIKPILAVPKASTGSNEMNRLREEYATSWRLLHQRACAAVDELLKLQPIAGVYDLGQSRTCYVTDYPGITLYFIDKLGLNYVGEYNLESKEKISGYTSCPLEYIVVCEPSAFSRFVRRLFGRKPPKPTVYLCGFSGLYNRFSLDSGNNWSPLEALIKSVGKSTPTDQSLILLRWIEDICKLPDVIRKEQPQRFQKALEKLSEQK